jgi:hypothetical protein
MKAYLQDNFVKVILEPEEKFEEKEFQKVDIVFSKHK